MATTVKISAQSAQYLSLPLSTKEKDDPPPCPPSSNPKFKTPRPGVSNRDLPHFWNNLGPSYPPQYFYVLNIKIGFLSSDHEIRVRRCRPDTASSKKNNFAQKQFYFLIFMQQFVRKR